MVHLRLEGTIPKFRPDPVLSIPLILFLHVAKVF